LVLSRCLTALAIGAAAILCLRATVGPVRVGPFTIGSPLPLEQIFWVALVLLGLLARNGSTMEPRNKGAAPLLPIGGILILVALFFSWNLHDSFLSDDYILISRTSLDLQTVKGFSPIREAMAHSVRSAISISLWRDTGRAWNPGNGTSAGLFCIF